MDFFRGLEESMQLPYIVVVGIVGVGITAFCVCFCVDLLSNKRKSQDITDKKKDRTPDIEMNTFQFTSDSPPAYSPRGFFLESARSGGEDEDNRSTPRVLRGPSSPLEGMGEGKPGRKSGKEMTSGSRGGQSSWAYVNLDFEKNAHLILSPGTLKKWKKEVTPDEEERKGGEGGTFVRKGDKVEIQLRGIGKGGKEEGKTGDTSTGGKSRSKETVELKTFESVRGNGDVERQSNSAVDMKGTLGSRTTSWEASSKGRESLNEAVEKSETESDPETHTDADNEETHTDADNEDTQGFRLRHLTKDWDTDVWRRGRKGAEGGEGESIHNEEPEEPPRDYDKDSNDKSSASSPRDSSVLQSSRLATATQLLQSLEEQEEKRVSQASTLERGYTTTLTRQQRGGWREGQISFFEEGKKRDFNYYSAR